MGRRKCVVCGQIDISQDISELQGANASISRKTVNGVNAAPGFNRPDQQGSGLLTQLFTLICGAVCKDTAFAEFIPDPKRDRPVMAGFSELNMESGFSKDICRSMVAMLDSDRSGNLGYEEFKQLLAILKNLRNVWALYDKDSSGSFSGFELKDALQSAGYRLNNRVLNALMHRYGNKNGQIQFDDFVMCATKLKTMIDIFKEKYNSETITATFSLQEWLEVTLYT